MSVVHVSSEVADAVAQGRPVLALESTIFTHGLPRPLNSLVALEAEETLRGAGVVPATVGVWRGTPTVGLTTDQIEALAADDQVTKVSVRDLPVALALGLNGGSTVAATAFLAHQAGVRVFSTGGLGGVHHGANETYDESADLFTLASVPIAVVSAGVKSILDVAATLERFETLNIPVLGYGTTRYPGFYVTDSGFELEYAVDGPEQAAAVIRARDALGVGSAVLFANPVPADQQLPPDELGEIVDRAWKAAEADGVTGKATTPYLLDAISRDTSGRSLAVNVAVYRGNVAVGAAIARALAG